MSRSNSAPDKSRVTPSGSTRARLRRSSLQPVNVKTSTVSFPATGAKDARLSTARMRARSSGPTLRLRCVLNSASQAWKLAVALGRNDDRGSALHDRLAQTVETIRSFVCGQ